MLLRIRVNHTEKGEVCSAGKQQACLLALMDSGFAVSLQVTHLPASHASDIGTAPHDAPFQPAVVAVARWPRAVYGFQSGIVHGFYCRWCRWLPRSHSSCCRDPCRARLQPLRRVSQHTLTCSRSRGSFGAWWKKLKVLLRRTISEPKTCD